VVIGDVIFVMVKHPVEAVELSESALEVNGLLDFWVVKFDETVLNRALFNRQNRQNSK
jgi:hypothetical protein